MYGVVYDSRNTFHKSSVSALAVGERVKFRIVVPRHFGCSYAFLCVKKDGTDYEKQGMFWAGMIDGDSEVWDITFSATERGLYFYHFELYTVYGVRYISKAEYGKGDICEEIRDFKQTVYERDDYGKTDLEGGLVYQIFPDRFCFSGQKKNGVPSDRILREDWYGEPEHLPDDDGRIKNNDYFCGDLLGIEQKLPYIKSLGVTHIYLNPIFEAHSNHRYNTANYEKIDPLLGDEKDFERLC